MAHTVEPRTAAALVDAFLQLSHALYHIQDNASSPAFRMLVDLRGSIQSELRNDATAYEIALRLREVHSECRIERWCAALEAVR